MSALPFDCWPTPTVRDGTNVGVAEMQPWQTKPTDDWSREDELAEADFRVCAIQARFDRDPTSRTTCIMLEWWEHRLAALLAGGEA